MAGECRMQSFASGAESSSEEYSRGGFCPCFESKAIEIEPDVGGFENVTVEGRVRGRRSGRGGRRSGGA